MVLWVLGARHVINVGFGRWLGSGFPWWTLCVNVVGCLLMGVVVEVLALKFKGSLDLRTFIATGIFGGFTTFSAFALDFASLVGAARSVGRGPLPVRLGRAVDRGALCWVVGSRDGCFT